VCVSLYGCEGLQDTGSHRGALHIIAGQHAWTTCKDDKRGRPRRFAMHKPNKAVPI